MTGMNWTVETVSAVDAEIEAPPVVLRDLPLQHLWIVYPGPDRSRLDKAVTVLPLAEIADTTTGSVA